MIETMLKIIPCAVGIEKYFILALEPNCILLCALLQNIPRDKENVEKVHDMQLGLSFKHNQS